LEEGFLIANQEVIAEMVVDLHLASHLTAGMLNRSEEPSSHLQILLYISLLFHMFGPIDVPLLIL
jgi:hypothetical protein